MTYHGSIFVAVCSLRNDRIGNSKPKENNRETFSV